MLNNTSRFLVLSLLSLVFATTTSAQHYRDKFPDGQFEDYTILTSDAQYLPHTFVGFRATGNPFCLYDNAGKFLLKTEYAYTQVGLYSRVGADCIVPFVRRHPTGKSSKLAFGGSATGEPFVFNMHMMRIKNLVKIFSFGTHFGYNYMMFREDARVQVNFEKNYFNLTNFRGHEFALGLGLYTRRGFAVTNKSQSNNAIEYFEFHSLLFSWTADVLINTGYTYDAKRYATYGDTLNWDDKYMTFPQIGGQLAFEMYWNPGWSKKNRSVSWGWSGRAAVRKNFIEGINAAFFVPEIMFGVYFNVLAKDKFHESSEPPQIEIWLEKHRYNPPSYNY